MLKIKESFRSFLNLPVEKLVKFIWLYFLSLIVISLVSIPFTLWIGMALVLFISAIPTLILMVFFVYKFLRQKFLLKLKYFLESKESVSNKMTSTTVVGTMFTFFVCVVGIWFEASWIIKFIEYNFLTP